MIGTMESDEEWEWNAWKAIIWEVFREGLNMWITIGPWKPSPIESTLLFGVDAE